jgi:hypothetical protein
VELPPLAVVHVHERRVAHDLFDAAAEVGARHRQSLRRGRYWAAMSRENVEKLRALWESWAPESSDLSLLDPEVTYEDGTLPDSPPEAWLGGLAP